MSNETKEAMQVLRTAIHNDEGYAISWHANIAMACYDSIPEDHSHHEDRHKIANEAAERFMKLAFNIDTSKFYDPAKLKNKG